MHAHHPDYLNHPGHADHDPNLSADWIDPADHPFPSMTLADLRRDTADMPGSARIFVLNPMGGLEPSAILTIEDLQADDPLRNEIPPDAIVFAPEAD